MASDILSGIDDDDANPTPTPPFPLPFPPLHASGIGLRPWGFGSGDVDALVQAWADPAIARGSRVPDDPGPDVAARWIAGEDQRRRSGQAVDLVITAFGQPEGVLGEVGLVLVEAERRWAEVGYWVAAEHRGAGRAAVALRLLSDWAFTDLDVHRLFARTDAANPAAARVAANAGYDQAGVLDGNVEVWVRDAPQHR